AALYRRLTRKLPAPIEVAAHLNEVANQWTAALSSAGVRAKRQGGRALYQWLLPWLNPAARPTNGDVDRLLRIAPYPGDDCMPFGYDFGEQLTLTPPRSQDGLWWFDDQPHTFVSVQALRRAPEIGHITAERRNGDHIFALFDRLPEHTIMA